ncbi:hypothetical protein [Azospirillum sp. sgz302134]
MLTGILPRLFTKGTAAPASPAHDARAGGQDRPRVTEADLHAHLVTLSAQDRQKLMAALDRAATRRDHLFCADVERMLRTVLHALHVWPDASADSSLWRAVSVAAAHTLVDAWSLERVEWAVPRPLLGALETWVSAYAFWPHFAVAYADSGDDPDARYLLMGAAMSVTGAALLDDCEIPALRAHAHRYIALSDHQFTRAIRLFARLLIVAPAVYDCLVERFGVSRAELAALPFQPPNQRKAVLAGAEADLAKIATAFAALPVVTEDQFTLAASQTALLFNRLSDVLLLIPPTVREQEPQLERSAFAPLVDFVITRCERHVATIDVALQAWLSEDIDGTAFAVRAAALREALEHFEADTRTVTSLLRLRAASAWGRRFTAARRLAGCAVADVLFARTNDLLAGCSFVFHNPSDPPRAVPSLERRANEHELIRLVDAAASVARACGNQVAAQTAVTNAVERVARQAVRIQRSWMTPGHPRHREVIAAVEHAVCLAAILDIPHALQSIALRSEGIIPNIYTELRCHRAGLPTRPCCRRLHAIFGSPAAAAEAARRMAASADASTVPSRPDLPR